MNKQHTFFLTIHADDVEELALEVGKAMKELYELATESGEFPTAEHGDNWLVLPNESYSIDIKDLN